MARILIATFGSLGDLHPFIAIAQELKLRGHQPIFATIEPYREKIGMLGFEFHPIRPQVDPENRDEIRKIMDQANGTEYLLKNIIFPHLKEQYTDLLGIAGDADLLLNGEAVYTARSVVEKTNIPWVSTTLAPVSLFSASDPSVYPNAAWLESTHFLGPAFHRILLWGVKQTIGGWYGPYKAFRRGIGLSESHDPIFSGKHSGLMNLVMFSSALAKPQPDWPSPFIQTGFCFYDGQDDLGKMPEGLQEFLDSGEAPIVFTLGSAAVMDARDFFEQSIAAAKILKKRAVLLYGVFNGPPAGLDADRAAFDYAPYSKVFEKAACVVHQGGVGTTSQVMRAGAPMLVMPYSHDQPDNAARCRRAGIARVISRRSYSAENAAAELKILLSGPAYRENAGRVKAEIAKENGAGAACDAIEGALRFSRAAKG